MTIEQKPELNRLIDSSIPLTWDYRRRQFKMLLPIWVFIWICFLEMGIWNAWLADKLSFDFILTLLGGCLFLLLIIFGTTEIQIRIQQRSKRVLKIDNKKISIRPAKYQFMPWKHVSKVQFEPIAKAGGMTKLSIFGFAKKQTPAARARWSMVIENPDQVQELIPLLRMKKSDLQIEVLEKPLPNEFPTPFPFFGLSVYLGGAFLLLHGAPILFSVFSGRHSEHHSNMTEEARAKLRHLIASHFSNVEELRHFFIVAGGTLTVLGVVLLIWGSKLMKQSRGDLQTRT